MQNLRSPNWRRILANLLLAVYGSAGILGYGLHALWHEHHHHFSDCSHHTGAHELCHLSASPLGHDHHQVERDTQLSRKPHSVDLAVQQLATKSHDCSICAFLAQAQSAHVAPTVLSCTGFTCFDQPVRDFLIVSEVIRLHLARGPPLA